MDMNPATTAFRLPEHAIEDPMAPDQPGDLVVVTSRRALCRVAYVAAEAASRFERENIKSDPMAWMLAPLRLFDGMPALDACLDRDAFLRAALLHGLSLGLDAHPEYLDDLLEEEEDGGGQEGSGGALAGLAVGFPPAFNEVRA